MTEWISHFEAIISIVIGIISTIYFYNKAKRDGERTNLVLTQKLKGAQKEIQTLRVLLDEINKSISNQQHQSLEHGEMLTDLHQRDEYFHERFNSDIEIYEKFKDFFISQRFKEAKNLFYARKQQIEDPHLRHYLEALVFYIDGKVEEAIRLLDVIILQGDYDGNFDPSEIYQYKGLWYLYDLNKPTEAIASLLEAKKRKPSSELAIHLAQAYFAINDIQQAKNELEEAKLTDPNNLSILFSLSTVFASLRDFDELRKLITTIEDKGFKNEYTYFYSGLIAENSKDFDGAITNYKKALELQPKMPEARIFLADLYFMTSKYLNCEEQVLAFMKYHPGNRKILSIYFSMLLYEGKTKKITQTSTSYNLSPESADIDDSFTLCSLGLAFEMEGMSDNAIECYQKVLEFYPYHVATLLNISQYYLKKNSRDLQKFDKYVARMQELNPRGITIFMLKALKETIFNRFDEANSLLSEAIQIDPQNSVAINNISHIKRHRNFFIRAEGNEVPEQNLFDIYPFQQKGSEKSSVDERRTWVRYI